MNSDGAFWVADGDFKHAGYIELIGGPFDGETIPFSGDGRSDTIDATNHVTGATARYKIAADKKTARIIA